MKSVKKIISIILTLAILMCIAPSVTASSEITVVLGGERLKFDVPPQIINSRTMVPLRAIFEELGATVDWDSDTKTVTSTKGSTTISLTIDSSTMFVNGEAVTLDSPACIVNSRTLVPVRAISEAFNLKVEWIEETRTVKITKLVSVRSEDSEGTVYTYNNRGNLTFANYSVGYWIKYSYDNNNNLIYEELSGGYWTKYTYDNNNNLIYKESANGYWTKYTYDNNDNRTYAESSEGDWVRSTYDNNNNLIYEELSDGRWNKYTYDNNNLAYAESSRGEWIKYTYDNGNLIYKEYSNGNWVKYTYDNNGNLIYEENSTGNWVKYIVIEK